MKSERKIRHAIDRLDDAGTDGQVRHEVSVHDIEVHPVGARGLDGSNLLAEA